uniref:Uncharacterized protein n=1 Tax=Rhizophora mucronata TaxID=61149 RepID=A0A2P2P2K7_RHIMU
MWKELFIFLFIYLLIFLVTVGILMCNAYVVSSYGFNLI